MKDQVVLSSKWYEKTWLVILLCILFFPVGLYALWRNSSIKKGWKVGVTVFFAIVVVANITKDKKTTPSKDNVVSKKEEIVKESVVKEPKSNWQYSEDKDEMTSQKRLFAKCLSTNEIQISSAVPILFSSAFGAKNYTCEVVMDFIACSTYGRTGSRIDLQSNHR